MQALVTAISVQEVSPITFLPNTFLLISATLNHVFTFIGWVSLHQHHTNVPHGLLSIMKWLQEEHYKGQRSGHQRLASLSLFKKLSYLYWQAIFHEILCLETRQHLISNHSLWKADLRQNVSECTNIALSIYWLLRHPIFYHPANSQLSDNIISLAMAQ